MIELAEEELARQAEGTRLEALHVKLGPLSGVVKEALLFSWDVACEGTPLAGSRLRIEESPLVVHCSSCGEDRTLDSIQELVCPVCAAPARDVVEGRELEVVALEIQ
jgi:hydrogenase nickel incorporation protein HypA/HybF